MAKKPTLNPVVPPVQPTEVKAANQPYEANTPTNFTVTPEGEKYGIVPINGTLGHVQAEQGQPYRNPEINKNIATLYQQEFAPNEQVDYNNPAKVQNFVSTQWAKNKDKMPELYARKNLISTQPIAESPKVEPTPEEKAQGLIDKAAATGKSWLQLYHEQMPKPEYNSKRANALQTNANLSVLADIIKLVGEGVTTDKGGTPIARQSIAPHLNAQLAQLNDLYKREVQSYNQNGFQYLMADERDKRARAAAANSAALKASAAAQQQKNWERQFELNGSSKEEAAQLARERMAQSDRQHKESLSATRQNHLETIAANKEGKKGEKEASLINPTGELQKVPLSELKAWAGKVGVWATRDTDKTGVTKDDATAYPDNVFNQHWDKYLKVENGHLVPKTPITQSYQGNADQHQVNGKWYWNEGKGPRSQSTQPIKSSYIPKPYNPQTNAFVPNNKPKSIYD